MFANLTSKALTLSLLALLLTMQYQLWYGEGGVLANYQITQDIELLRQSNHETAQRNAILAADVKDLRRGDEAVEERARSVLGMIRPGETFYHIVENQ